MKSKRTSARHARATRPGLRPPVLHRDVLRRLFPEPHLALGTAWGNTVPAEWRVFEAEAQEVLRHPYGVPTDR